VALASPQKIHKQNFAFLGSVMHALVEIMKQYLPFKGDMCWKMPWSHPKKSKHSKTTGNMSSILESDEMRRIP
jgi:hypothetical protein